MKTKHWIVFILLGAIWSSSFLWIKIGVQDIGPMSLVAFRMLFGAITAVAIGIYQKVEWPRDWKTWGIFAILGPASLAIPIFFISWGEQTIDSAVASILNATTPLFTILLAHFLLQDDKMTPQKVLGLLIGFAGVVILLSKDLTAGAQNSVIGQAAVILRLPLLRGERSLWPKTYPACSRHGSRRDATHHIHDFYVDRWPAYGKTI